MLQFEHSIFVYLNTSCKCLIWFNIQHYQIEIYIFLLVRCDRVICGYMCVSYVCIGLSSKNEVVRAVKNRANRNQTNNIDHTLIQARIGTICTNEHQESKIIIKSNCGFYP